ncbi:MAG TPA: DUF423 domain-containing protein [Rhodothermales bacterium]|nr:DUF423 domain-containing protein [Rhodothermales bacterium]
MTPKILIAVGAVLAGIGVGAGAFGAHGLSDVLSPARLSVYETAVRYHLIHALALVVTGVLATSVPSVQVAASGYLFLAGILLFSGSLYLLVLTDTPWLGAVTPVGGAAWIAGWAVLAYGAWNGLP